MQHLKILNSRDVKRIMKELQKIYATEISLDYAFFQNTKGKFYILSKQFGELEDKGLRINNLGLYFGKMEKDTLRLSIEGAQLIQPKKNLIDVNQEQVESWMKGEDLVIEGLDLKGYVIICYKKDIYGVGKYKEGKILNYVPKDRRIKSQVS